MKKNYLRSSIIVLTQTILPILVLLVITPWLIRQTTSFSQWHTFLSNNHHLFLMMHIGFYIALILFWPKLVKTMKTQATTQQQLSLAKQARWYLVGIFLLIELITQLHI